MSDQRNTILAIILSLVVLVAWQMFFTPEAPKTPVEANTEAAPAAAPAAPLASAVQAPTTAAAAEPEAAPEERVRISTAQAHGSISLKGGRFDDITLANYRETMDPTSPEIVLLAPATSPKPYYAEWGWIAGDNTVALPSATTVWTRTSSEAVLTETSPLVLTWDNGQGLKFTRTIRADKAYLFTVEQAVENTGEHPVTLYPYGFIAQIDRHGSKQRAFIHEGPLGVFDRTLKEVTYDDLKKAGRETVESTGGWIGITEKYWLAAAAFDPGMKITGSYNYADMGGRERYQTDLRGDAVTVPPGGMKAVTGYLFAGAKELNILDAYADNPGIPRFDLAIDFGWYYFLAKPFFIALQWLHGVLGNFGLAIIAFSTFVRLLMFPIANRQYRAMNKMRALQPEMKKLQERHADDKTKLNQAMMELYQREKTNPLAGCLPVFIQIPVFYALYKVLSVSIEMRHAPFYGWIHDLSAQDPTSILNLFGLLPFGVPASLAFISLGVWPLIYGITMLIQQKMAPVTDPTQARVMMLMPIVFTFVMATFPAGLLIYWAWSNILAILQQWFLAKRAGLKT